MDNYQLNKSKRIASNTIFLFIRMFVLTVINLYAVRLILRGLGEEDYGIFNTIAGVVTTMSCIGSVLALSVQRFYSYALGKKDNLGFQKIFSASININIITAILILILLESVGLWFIKTQLIIPADRMNAAFYLFHYSLFTFICSILQIPFHAAIIAHEEMGFYALISTIECFLKLLIAALIGRFLIDNLIFYGFGLFAVALIVLFMYVIVCHNRYSGCHYVFTKERKLYKQLISFSGWTFYGSLAGMGMTQGSIILLNIFFGPLANAAFGIALQIQNAFNALCNSIVLAIRPAMIRAYAEENFSFLNQLFTTGNKFLLYVLSAVSIPIIFEMDLILKVWLGDVREETVLFSRLIIIYVICMAIHNPITTIMHAIGCIRQYHFPVESITILCFPLTWLLFSLGMPSSGVFASMIFTGCVAHLVRLYCLRRYYPHYSLREYLLGFILPSIVIILFVLVFTYLLHANLHQQLIRFIAVGLLSPLVFFIVSFFIGINHKEKELCYQIFKQIIHRG